MKRTLLLILALASISYGFEDGMGWGRPAKSYLVAASTAPASYKSNAKYTCDGTADNVEIQAAVDAAFADGGGTVYLSSGTFTCAARAAGDNNSIILKSGVKIIGVNPLLTVADALDPTKGAPSDTMSITGGTILTGAGITIFAANTDARPANDYALTGVQLSNLGFKTVARCIYAGNQDHGSFCMSSFTNLYADTVSGVAIDIGNFQFLRMQNIYLFHSNGGIHAYNWHRRYAGGNSVWDDIWVSPSASAPYGIKLEAIPSGSASESSCLNYIQGNRWQVNCFAGGTTPANLLIVGTSNVFPVLSRDDNTHVTYAGTTGSSWFYATGGATGTDNHINITTSADVNVGHYHLKSVTVGTNTTLETWENLDGGINNTHKIHMVSPSSSYSPVQHLTLKGLDLEGPYATNRIDAVYNQISAFEISGADGTVVGILPACKWRSSRFITVFNYDQNMRMDIDNAGGNGVAGYNEIVLYGVLGASTTSSIMPKGAYATTAGFPASGNTQFQSCFVVNGSTANWGDYATAYSVAGDFIGRSSAILGNSATIAAGVSWGAPYTGKYSFSSTTGGTNALQAAGKASAAPYKIIILKKTGSGTNAITIDFSGVSDTIDGAASMTLTNANDTACIQSDGVSGWHTLWKNF